MISPPGVRKTCLKARKMLGILRLDGCCNTTPSLTTYEQGAFDMADLDIHPTPPRVKDITGLKFGRLTAIGFHSYRNEKQGKRTRRMAVWVCECECGNKKAMQAVLLKSGTSRSCGCLQLETMKTNGLAAAKHGMHRSAEYGIWAGMKYRCNNPKSRIYNYYGGRGITVCDRWLHSFEAFYADMGPRPSPKHSIDRIDNDGNYEPGNCRWATQAQQAANQRRGNQHIGSYR